VNTSAARCVLRKSCSRANLATFCATTCVGVDAASVLASYIIIVAGSALVCIAGLATNGDTEDDAKTLFFFRKKYNWCMCR
jgi:hypothetical protein